MYEQMELTRKERDDHTGNAGVEITHWYEAAMLVIWRSTDVQSESDSEDEEDEEEGDSDGDSDIEEDEDDDEGNDDDRCDRRYAAALPASAVKETESAILICK
jgi:predicted metal-dependent peptidase